MLSVKKNVSSCFFSGADAEIQKSASGGRVAGSGEGHTPSSTEAAPAKERCRKKREKDVSFCMEKLRFI